MSKTYSKLGGNIMKKWTILDENFMSLEQKVAEALDSAEKQVKTHLDETVNDLNDIVDMVEEGKSFHLDPAFINFKNEGNLVALGDTVKSSLALAAKKCREKSTISLNSAAVISTADNMLHKEDVKTFDSEIHELVNFFGYENTDIPDVVEGEEFMVHLKDNAHKVSLEKLAQFQDLADQASTELKKALATGQTKESLKSSLEKLVLLKELAQAFN
jgi:hypothetical protein